MMREVSLPQDLKEIEIKMNSLKKESQKNLKLAKENEQKKNDLIVYLAHDIKNSPNLCNWLFIDIKRRKYLKLKTTKKVRLYCP